MATGRTEDNSKARRSLLTALVMALVVTGGLWVSRGCSNGDELMAPTSQPSDANGPSDPLTGRWRGRWTSDGIHGSGDLVAAIRRQDEGVYVATFRAKFGGGLFSMTQPDVTLRVSGRSGSRVTFEGEKDLGLLNGGVYTYVGHAGAGEFEATYESSLDTGVFTLKRLPAADVGSEPNALPDPEPGEKG